MIKKILVGIVILASALLFILMIYASGSYEPLPEMSEEITKLTLDDVTVEESFDHYSIDVPNEQANILFIPGGLVEPHSYDYLLYQLALHGYDVTVFKPFFNLAILTPGYANRFVLEDTILIGHSLGGVVGSMIASDSPSITRVVLLGSYPIKDLATKEVLFITAEFDLGMDQDAFQESLEYVQDAEFQTIKGGNHAQFGWYGEQKGDGEAFITTLAQQDQTIELILEFIK